jgi:ATP-binding cassette subfamily B protein
VLDEATSSIDTQTEQLIQQATGKLLKGHTSFIIAHRLSTIRQADLILVVKDGKIIERGTHRELLEEKGYYYDLYSRQFEEEASMQVFAEGGRAGC